MLYCRQKHSSSFLTGFVYSCGVVRIFFSPFDNFLYISNVLDFTLLFFTHTLLNEVYEGFNRRLYTNLTHFLIILVIIVEWRYLELCFKITLAVATEIRLRCP